MSAARRLALARDARDSARDVFEVRLAQVQDDLAARGIGGRLADRVGEGARETFDHALEVADEHPGVIAGTFAALLLWIMRTPLMGWLNGRFAQDEEIADADDD